MTQAEGDWVELRIGSQFEHHVEAAIVRFGYLRPDVTISREADVLRFISERQNDLTAITREFQFALYRQRIYAESSGLRERLIAGVMGT